MIPQERRFDVFGRRIAIRAVEGGWRAFLLGNEGKRRPADFVVPDDIPPEGLAQFLGDLFHESATPLRNDVRELD